MNVKLRTSLLYCVRTAYDFNTYYYYRVSWIDLRNGALSSTYRIEWNDQDDVGLSCSTNASPCINLLTVQHPYLQKQPDKKFKTTV